MARRTLAGTAVVQGIGLHTGREATARCIGAPSGQGIVFRRIDLAGAPSIPARVADVQSTERRTALGDGDAAVQTVEHLLAAAAALSLDDLTVELDGPEPPIGDGSFAPFPRRAQRGRDRRSAGRARGLPGDWPRSRWRKATRATWWRRPPRSGSPPRSSGPIR